MFFHKILLPLTFGPQPGKQQKLGVYKLHNFLGLIVELTVFFKKPYLHLPLSPKGQQDMSFPIGKNLHSAIRLSRISTTMSNLSSWCP